MRFIFGKGDIERTPSATYTESAPAVPQVPASDFRYVDITNTIESYPHLFKVVTPIIADRLEELLQNHPNIGLVHSICQGLRSGFWPFADTENSENLPQGYVTRPHGLPTLDNESLSFLKSQRDTEISAGRYSLSFGPKLLPGMVAQPIFTVPKKGSAKLRLVNDHSAGLKSLNSLIPTEGGFVILDNLSDLGANIRAMMRKNPESKPKFLWKSDASQAYRRLPMHPRWQIRQATLIDGNYHVDRCAVFGNRASGRLWCLFFGLVCWVGIHERGIEGLLHYVDDAFNVSFHNELSFYAPYKRWMPTDQTRFLSLLDHIGIPHEDKKQLFGESLEIIGLVVDLRNMSISMSHEARKKLVEAIYDFVLHTPDNKRQQPLRVWLRTLGYANWALNAFPILKPALNSSYDKITGKVALSQGVYINKRVRDDLLWFADSVDRLEGVRLFEAEEWSADAAELEIWSDASRDGLGFWVPKFSSGFIGDVVLGNDSTFNIFLNEAIAILAALHWSSSLHPTPTRLAIHTDSSNSFNIFNSLRASNAYNAILMSAAMIRIDHGIDLRVFFIEGKQNIIADALSRRSFEIIRNLVPDVTIRHFTPPISPDVAVMGASSK